MTVSVKQRSACAGALAILLFSACSGKSGDVFAHEDGLLRFVPADTPYVFASGEPLDDDFMDALEPHVNELLSAYRDMLLSMAEKQSGEEGEDAETLAALLTELSPLFSVEGWKDAGFERDDQMVLYGNGLLPVFRVEVSDPEAFEKTLAGLEVAAGEPMPVASIDGNEYRYVGDDRFRVIVGLFDGTAVVTALPAEFDEAQTAKLLGLELPAKSIAETTLLSDIVEKYEYTNHYTGFIDTLRLVDSFLAEPTSINAALMEHLEFDTASVTDVCRAEIRELAGIAPRTVFGYDEISVDRISGSLVVELRQDIANGLQGISAAVPGLGQDQGGVLSIGASVNMKALRDFYAARLDAMEADPFECDYFADLQAGVAQGRELLAKPLPPMVYGIRGFNAVLETLDVAAITSGQAPDPTTVEAGIVVAMDDAAALVAMGTMFSPELAELNLQPNGEAVALALPQVEMMGVDAYAAMVEDALSIAIGPAAQSRVTSLLAASSMMPAPVFAMTMDAGKYYELIAAGMSADMGDGEEQPMTPEEIEAVQRVFASLSDIYDRMTTIVHFTADGAVLDSVMTLKDL
jgi:hypothetical protein